jgi:iron complex outermembrane recepter protein
MKKLSILGLILIINNIFLMASEQVSLVGKVTDEDNRPVKEITVTLDGKSNLLAITDSIGYFTIKKITPGKYSLKIKSNDYESHSEEITISDEEITTINIVLNKRSNFLENLTMKVIELIIEIIK